MPENSPQDNDAPQNLATGIAPQSSDANATMGMVVYQPKLEAQNEPIVVPTQFPAEDVPQFIPQHMPENVQVNNQYRPDNGRSCENISQEQVYGNNVPLSDELGRQTGSRVHFDENLYARRPREEEPGRMGSHTRGSHRGESHRGESHRREPHRPDVRETKSHKKESHHSSKSGSHRSASHKKDSHKSGSDRNDSHRSESRRSQPHQKESHGRDSRKSSKKEESHKTKKIDVTPIYGRPSFWATLGHHADHTPYVRYPVETRKRGN